VSSSSWPTDAGLSEKIRQRLNALSPSERRVARALLAGPPTIGLESSAQLARRAGVSGTTVSRFSAQLGYASYAAFQSALRDEIAARVMTPVEVYRSHTVTHSSADLLTASSATMAESVARSVLQLSPGDFRRATALLADNSRQVLAAGGWFSYFLAGYLAAILRQIRPHVRAVPPVASERTAAIADIGRRDVVVVFDFRRYEKDTLEFARAARASSARIVLLTDPWLSPVAEIADAVLPAQVTGPSAFESLTPTLAVVETLITAVADHLGDDGRRRLERFGGVAELWGQNWSDDAAPASTIRDA
jgi:DNA-binding MurR/RpiR family transcriptional regulator